MGDLNKKEMELKDLEIQLKKLEIELFKLKIKGQTARMNESKINLNLASREQLRLPGISDATAQSILNAKTERDDGVFTLFDQVEEIDGVGIGKIKILKTKFFLP